MTIFYADCSGNAQNAVYPHRKRIESVDEFLDIVKHDHVAALYKDNYRAVGNFYGADCLAMDCDNPDDNPETWKTPDDVADAFEDVPFYVAYSRNHMKAKGAKEPRPKFHVYFPIDVIRTADEYTALKEKVLKVFPYFDDNAKDAARFFFGSDNGGTFIPGESLLTSVIWQLPDAVPLQKRLAKNDDRKSKKVSSPVAVYGEGRRDNALYSRARAAFDSGFTETETLAAVEAVNRERCEPPLSEKDVQRIVKSAAKKAPKLEESENLLADLGFYSLDQLSADERRPPEFIVDGMIPTGMTFITGAPKIRKSFFALQMSACVATGVPFLGHTTKRCDVAYFDLEGSKSRASSRDERMSVHVPHNVFITHRIKSKLSDGLTDVIRGLHRQNPTIRLVIVDTYSRARGAVKSSGQNAYDMDVEFLEPIQQMAVDENIALVFITHDKKGAALSTDALERVSGTMGITGSADSVLTLSTKSKRFEGTAELEYNPRDAKGGEMSLVFDEYCCEWREERQTAFDPYGNPLTRFCIENVPDRGLDSKFFPYALVWKSAYGCMIEGASEKIRKDLTEHREELFRDYGIAIQLGVKTNSERGLRLMKVF